VRGDRGQAWDERRDRGSGQDERPPRRRDGSPGSGKGGGGGGGGASGRVDGGHGGAQDGSGIGSERGDDQQPQAPKVEPNFGVSGKLAAETNEVNGVVMKFQPPPEARRCTNPRWRLYIFKGDAQVGWALGGMA
jgi:smad nuclear-interacting protein 1